jgi:hypothetical protein
VRTRKPEPEGLFEGVPATLAAFASIRPGKKNSRGARHVRQIDVRNLVLTQVKHDVTECSRLAPVEPGPKRSSDDTELIRMFSRNKLGHPSLEARVWLRSPHIGTGMAHQDIAPLTSTAPTVRLPTRKIR